MTEELDQFLQDPKWCHDEMTRVRDIWGSSKEGDQQIKKMLGLIQLNSRDPRVKERALSLMNELDLRNALCDNPEQRKTIMSRYLSRL